MNSNTAVKNEKVDQLLNDMKTIRKYIKKARGYMKLTDLDNVVNDPFGYDANTHRPMSFKESKPIYDDISDAVGLLSAYMNRLKVQYNHDVNECTQLDPKVTSNLPNVDRVRFL